MTRVVVDTNVYISAILFGGKSEEIRNLARAGKIEILISEEILAELAGVLKRKFGWINQQISEFLEEIRTISALITPVETLSVIKEKESNNRVLECAVEGKAQYIVSGNEHHILPLKEFKGIKILNVAEFLNSIRL